MKPFDLDEYLKNPSREVVTRDGRKVKIRCTNLVSDNPVVAQIDGTGYSLSYPKDGKCSACQNSIDDLFFATEKHEGWVNVYRDFDDMMCGSVFATEEDAKCNAKTAIATVKIEWEE